MVQVTATELLLSLETTTRSLPNAVVTSNVVSEQALGRQIHVLRVCLPHDKGYYEPQQEQSPEPWQETTFELRPAAAVDEDNHRPPNSSALCQNFSCEESLIHHIMNRLVGTVRAGSLLSRSYKY
jgi:hypothetical protein